MAGTVTGALTVANRATISGGTSTALGTGATNTFGTLATNTGTTIFGTGGVYAWKDATAPASGVAGTNWDTLSLNALNVTATNSSPFVISLSSFNGTSGTLGGTPTGLSNNGTVYSWTIATTATTAQINGVNVTSEPSDQRPELRCLRARYRHSWKLSDRRKHSLVESLLPRFCNFRQRRCPAINLQLHPRARHGDTGACRSLPDVDASAATCRNSE